ncbi:MAG: calcium-translocating P-type ATPase, PMCA-type [Synergistaceae bacterium]|jgi:Ca2+-transporting ATPase|nr:calcium-translocating P-type ATPase, PMCA-type [Synergistaceae bacterium]
MTEQTEKKHTEQFQGLTEQEVLASRAEHGMNVLTPPERDPWWKLFLEKFEDPIIRILLIAAGVSFLVSFAHGEYTESVGIVAAILLATTMAFINEYKAGKEFDVLNQVSDDVDYRVIRSGDYHTVSKKDIVVGDILLLEQGEEIPADACVVRSISLQIDESKITGESVPAPKFAIGEVPEGEADKQTAYPIDHVYRGTMVREGHGVVRVTSVGDSTEIGHAAKEASEESGEETPLNRQLEGLSKLIGVVGFGIAALLFAALTVRGAITGGIVMSQTQWIFLIILIISVMIALMRVWLPIVYDFFEVTGKPKDRPEWLEDESLVKWLKQICYGAVFFVAAVGIAWVLSVVPDPFSAWPSFEAGRQFLQFFMIAITIIVVAVPEGLAMSVTLSLAYSMRKMTATNNLVRRMHACETIGAATVICTDKTGTLTQNEMSVFETKFPFLDVKKGRGRDSALIYETMAANSTAHLSRGEKVEALGNPTESALLLWLEANGIDYRAIREGFDLTEQLAFSTERKFMATLGRSPQNGEILHVKGAPEVVLAKCVSFFNEEGEPMPITDEVKSTVLDGIRSYQRRGMRVLGFACRSGEGLPPGKMEENSSELTWIGFTAIADPVRAEVPDAIRACSKSGIGVKIVTGDNQETAKEIGRQIGLLNEGDDIEQVHLTGTEFEERTDDELLAIAPKLKILSRAKPQHKLRLVRTLQKLGEVVAVTGDGTNDAPALNHANVGLAMGKAGTAVAKEASDIILLDDSFRSIVNAIMWGRSLYQNIQRFVLFQLTVNVTALFIALIGPFIGVELPLTVTQMLWVNLIMDTFAALALAAEPPHQDVMKNKPRDPEAFIVTSKMWQQILGYAAVFIVILVGMLLKIKDGGITDYELSLFFNVFVMLQLWNLFNARCLGLSGSAFSGVFENRGFVCIAFIIFVGQILITQFGGEAFRTEPLSAEDWAFIIIPTSIVLWVGEILRFIRRRSANA